MKMESRSLYLDEFGNTDLNHEKSGASEFFIIAGVMIDSDKEEEIRSDVESIKVKLGIQGELKSSKLNKRPEKRIDILTALSELDVRFVAIAIDKKEIEKESGLQYKKSFIKYCSSRLYALLGQYHDDLTVFADEHGSEEFMESYEAYITQKEDTLFADNKLHFVDSEIDVLVQVADLIAGTLARVYEKERYDDEYSVKFYAAIKDKVYHIEEWPKRYESLYYQQEPTSEYDSSIRIFAEKQALKFIEKNMNSRDEDTQKRVQTLRCLLYEKRFSISDGYMSAKNIIPILIEKYGVERLSRQAFRNDVIAKLRDEDVLISSCSDGYKIPESYEDLCKYAEQINLNVIPMLNRLDRSRTHIRILTDNKLDIIDGDGFSNLKALLDCHERYQSNMNIEG